MGNQVGFPGIGSICATPGMHSCLVVVVLGAGPFPMSKKKGDWDCPKCGTHNFASKSFCFSNQCSEKRPGADDAGAAGDDWVCVCGVSNFAGRKSCRGCFVPRPGEPKNGKPSWWCAKCAFDIYPTKPACGKCKTPRPNRYPELEHANVIPAGKAYACSSCAALTGWSHGPACKGCGKRFVSESGGHTTWDWEAKPISPEETARKRQEEEETERKRRRIEELERDAEVAERTRRAAALVVDTNPDGDVEATDGDPECKICMAKRVALCINPCQHACICRGCYHQLLASAPQCPICRGPIESVLNMRF